MDFLTLKSNLLKPDDFQKKTERVYHSMEVPSHIELFELEH